MERRTKDTKKRPVRLLCLPQSRRFFFFTVTHDSQSRTLSLRNKDKTIIILDCQSLTIGNHGSMDSGKATWIVQM